MGLASQAQAVSQATQNWGRDETPLISSAVWGEAWGHKVAVGKVHLFCVKLPCHVTGDKPDSDSLLFNFTYLTLATC